MMKYLSLLLTIVTLSNTLSADESRVYRFIRSQQQPSGLFRNQTDDPFSGLYVTALGSICLLHQGQTAEAEKVFDLFDAWRVDHWGNTPELQGFPQAWNADTGMADEKSDRWIGDNAWLLLALEYHHRMTGSTKYLLLRTAIADWLVGLQDEDGGIKAGFNRNGPMLHQSTEGNLDSYAALALRPEAQKRIYSWLLTKMWIPREGRFRTGSTEESSALDCLSWSVAALGPDFSACLDYAEKTYVITAAMDGFPDRKAQGFGDLPGKQRVWFEGTGEMIVAYRAAGRHDAARKWIAEMDKVALTLPDNAAGWPCSSNDPAWNGGSTRPFVASGAWYLFGCWNFNPMNSGSWKAAERPN